MMPRRSAIVTASVRSLTCSLEKIFRTCIFTVSSAIDSLSAISLFRFPSRVLGEGLARSRCLGRQFKQDATGGRAEGTCQRACRQ